MHTTIKYISIALFMSLVVGCGDDADTSNENPEPPDGDERLDEDAAWWAESDELYATAPALGDDGSVYFGGWDGVLYAVDEEGE
ncbi:MAG: PQQ-binding-like beta-propeller repeat protein, partial [Persicimonas sp.]